MTEIENHFASLLDTAEMPLSGVGPGAAPAASSPRAIATSAPKSETAVPLSPALREAWVRCFESDPNAAPKLHPDVALFRLEYGETPPLIYTHMADAQADGARAVRTLAVLQPDAARVRPLPRIPWHLHLYGRQLAADRLVGEQTPEALDRFLGAVEELLVSGKADCLTLEDLDTESPLWKALDRLGSRSRRLSVFHPRRPQPHWWIEFPANPEDYWQRFRGKSLKKMRARARDLGGIMRCHRTVEQVPGFLNAARGILNIAWQGTHLERRIRNDERACAYWSRVAALGALRCYTLELPDGKPIAFDRAIQWNGTLLLDEGAYDPTYASQGPGKALLLAEIEDCIAHDTPQRIDFGPGDYEYKQYLCNKQTLTGPVTIVPNRWKPLAVMTVDYVRREAHAVARAALRKMNVLDGFKKFLRRHVKPGSGTGSNDASGSDTAGGGTGSGSGGSGSSGSSGNSGNSGGGVAVTLLVSIAHCIAEKLRLVEEVGAPLMSGAIG